MRTRTIAVLTLTALFCLVAPACSRLARSAMRANRNSSSRSSQPSPEQMKIDFTALDARSSKIISDSRAKWATYCEKYSATDLTGAAQVIAVVDGFNNAHWSEKPQAEDLAPALGTAIGDVLKAEGNIDWVLAEGSHICLVSPNGKVAFAPVATATQWLKSKTHPMSELKQEVAQAIRETTGEPVLIGFDEGEDESTERELR